MAGPYKVSRWLEHIESPLTPLATTPQGHGIWYQNDRVDYLGCWPDRALLHDALSRRCAQAGIETCILPDGLRLRQRGDVMFAINYDAVALSLDDYLGDLSNRIFLIGGPKLAPAGVAAWKVM
jgi:beta-galactosidase